MKTEFSHICASYRKKRVLQDITFSLEEGSITALIGRNGAGKSTLISCLTGEKTDYDGTILLDGRDIRTMDVQTRARLISCLPQNLPKPHVTVRELVTFGRTPYLPLTGKLSKNDEIIIDRALEVTNMTAFADAFVDTLSGGERRRAFLAMTFAQNTPLIVLDEPTAHLDANSRFELMALIDNMRKTMGKTFLIVMHDLPEVLRCANQIAVLHDKQLTFFGNADECLAQQIPQKCFNVRVHGSKEDGYAVIPMQ
ncbi:MAG: ABC transporter ATP-binding protein [Clostridia bacterium]|nr:ABC transporter ATP-binding protein [Clostridia bacterium]